MWNLLISLGDGWTVDSVKDGDTRRGSFFFFEYVCVNQERFAASSGGWRRIFTARVPEETSEMRPFQGTFDLPVGRIHGMTRLL